MTTLLVICVAGLFGVACWTNDRLRNQREAEEMIGQRSASPEETQMVYQDRQNNCGAAALKMILDHYGHEYSLREIEHKLKPSRRGISFLQLQEAATHYGVTATGVRLTVKELTGIQYPVIMLVRQDHYVVVDGMGIGKSVLVRDPARGKLKIPVETLSRTWTGETLMFAPNRYKRESSAHAKE